jgi:hypothetical protein
MRATSAPRASTQNAEIDRAAWAVRAHSPRPCGVEPWPTNKPRSHFGVAQCRHFDSAQCTATAGPAPPTSVMAVRTPWGQFVVALMGARHSANPSLALRPALSAVEGAGMSRFLLERCSNPTPARSASEGPFARGERATGSTRSRGMAASGPAASRSGFRLDSRCQKSVNGTTERAYYIRIDRR